MKKIFIINDEAVSVEGFAVTDGEVRFMLDGREYHFNIQADNNGHFVLKHEGHSRKGYVSKMDPKGVASLFLHGEVEVSISQKGRALGQSTAKNIPHAAPMPGTIQNVLVKAGDVVEEGQTVVVMEAMKLQLNITAAYAGTVKEVCCEAGGLVNDGALLIKITPLESI